MNMIFLKLICLVDHLVVSAGVTPVSMFEDTFEVDNFSPAMVNPTILVLYLKIQL